MKHCVLCQMMLAATLFSSTAAFAATAITPGTGVQNLKQGESYTFANADGYYVNSSFFSKNTDGTYTFHAIDGTYQIETDDNLKYLQVRPVQSDGSLATLSDDGTGALWIIGNGIGLPSVSDNQVGWTTEKAIAMAQTSDMTYEISGVVGKEFAAVPDFKFFGQAGWGIEFKGSTGSNYTISTANGPLAVGTGSNGHDDGNLYLTTDAEWAMGDTVTIVVDLTYGVQAATLTTTVKKASTVFNPTLNGESFQSTTYGYVWGGILTQGEKITFAGADAFNDEDWYMDPDFFEKDGDGYKFLAMDGLYAVMADFTLKYFKVFEIGTDQLPVAYDKTTGKGNIWVIGDTGIGKPSFAKNGHNWYTGYNNDIPLAKISSTKYRLTVNAGQEIDLSNNFINFKFFGQPDWGMEFDTDPSITLAGELAPYFAITKGNITFGALPENMTDEQKAMIQSIKTLVFTIDVTDPAAATLTIEAKLKDNPQTGINTICEAQPQSPDTSWYTVDGRRYAKKPAKAGLYIYQGRKVMVK